jgi:hypothetical protein
MVYLKPMAPNGPNASWRRSAVSWNAMLEAKDEVRAMLARRQEEEQAASLKR